MQVYQAKLLEMAQANVQFAFEFGPRLATIRSPFEFFALISEFATGGSTCSRSIRKKWRHIRFGASTGRELEDDW